MILMDFSGVAIGTISVQKLQTEEQIRHAVLNSIRTYNLKFRDKYGQMVICCDGGSWRRDIFPEYKHKRRETRDDQQESEKGLDWKEIFRILNIVKAELISEFPYKVVHVPGVEADDIIGVLVETTQDFGCGEDVMIISADKDFLQLQKYNNVRQWSTRTKKFLQEPNPKRQLQELIFKGDKEDGIPNIFMPNDTFVTGERQKAIRQGQLDEWYNNIDNLESVMGEEVYKNYKRNQQLIDLTCIPETVQTEIINTYKAAPVAPKMKILNYLISKRCKLLINCVRDFY